MEINLEVLYIIIGIIYFIYTVIRNMSKKPVTRQDEAQDGPVASEADEEQRPRRRETVSNPFDETVGRPVAKKPSYFEELLEEFEQSTVENRHKKEAEEKVKKIKEVDDEYRPAYGTPDISLSEKEAEKRIRETEARKALQEKASAVERAEAIGEEVHRKIQQETTLDTIGQPEPDRRTRRGGQSVNHRRRQILNMLRNPENLKNTIVVSEILRPKYLGE